jgi:benzodiazapine receptor
MKARSILTLVICLLIPLVLGAIAGNATSRNIADWYVHLNKPSFTPPNGVFAPVWTALYALMGISSFLIWKQPHSEYRRIALILYAVQLMLNFFWSFLFFYFRLTGAALVEILVLLTTVIFWVYATYKVHRVAALLQIPYILWLLSASVLNAAIVYLNRVP